MHIKRWMRLILLAVCLLWGNLTPAYAQECLSEDAPGCTHGLPTDQYQRLLAQMEAYPAPRVTPIPIRQKEVDAYTFYRVSPGAPRYSAPHGEVIGSVGDGLNFVSIYGIKDGFAKMRDGAWMALENLTKTYASELSGVLFTEPPSYPVAWVLQASIPSRIPGGITRAEWPAVKRYTLVNIYATVRRNGWNWYLIAPGQWIEQRKVGLINPQVRPDHTPKADERWVSVDLYEQVMGIYEGENLIGAALVSTGISPLNTPTGTYQVYQRLERANLRGSMGEADGYSLPAVPYALFYEGDLGLHGVYWHDGFGFKRSHGCVNLSVSDAGWLFQWTEGGTALTVVVWSSGK
ncbi:MAG: L,D-transpeptidase [Anaerolineae bacterium]|nr:L,D-transpeptidase [Anaerolineae bacterium]CAG1015523.1 hypothetical protein ANRL4_05517 [Anaerolineae bacterium]